MATIVTRSGKGSPLTHAEVDANFENLNSDKLEASGGTVTGALGVTGNLTVDTDTLFVDAASNNVGIGTSLPGGKLDVFSSAAANVALFRAGAAQNSFLSVIGNGNSFLSTSFDMIQDTLNQAQLVQRANAPMLFFTNNTERMRIDALGNLLVGTTSGGGKVRIDFAGLTSVGVSVRDTDATGTTQAFTFFKNNSQVGSITTSTTATAYVTSSDYRLKENVVPLAGAADRLAQIPVHRFNFIADPDTTVDGFLAHEVQAFVPECVTGLKDQVETVEVTDEDGNVIIETRPVYQGIDQSKLVPLLTAALQEALARIETLEADVAALKGKPA